MSVTKTTTTPRRRSTESISPPIGTRSSNKRKKKNDDGIAAQESDMSATNSGVVDSWSIVQELFCHAPPGIWWRIMPENNGNDDIAYATSVDWEDIYTLLMDVKILEKRKIMGTKRVCVMNGALDKLVTKVQSTTRLQFCNFRTSEQKERCYYVCIGAAKYPTKHLARAKAAGICLRPSAVNEFLRSKCRNAACNIRERERERASEQDPEQGCDRGSQSASEQENQLLQATAAVNDEQEQPQQAEQEVEYIDILDWENERTEKAIQVALHLDFKSIPRYVRGSNNDKVIPLHPRKQFNAEERALVLLLAHDWGFQDLSKNFDEKRRIGMAACTQMAFDCGFKEPVGSTQVRAWFKSLQDAFLAGEPKLGLQNGQTGSQKVLDKLEKSHPGYVRELFHYAQQTCGPKVTFKKLAERMKARSADPHEERPTILKLDRRQVADWYRANKDAEIDLDNQEDTSSILDEFDL